MTTKNELKKQAYASALKSRALSVLLYLIDRTNSELTCFPSIHTIADHLHISTSTVKRALHELVESGYIRKEARFRDKNHGQTSNLYTLLLFDNSSGIGYEEVLENTKPLKDTKHISFYSIKDDKQPHSEDILVRTVSSAVYSAYSTVQIRPFGSKLCRSG